MAQKLSAHRRLIRHIASTKVAAMTEDSDKVLRNYQLALAEFGRPVGPFEVGREHIYNAVASAKRGPSVEQRHQELPAAPVRPVWRDDKDEGEEPPF